jgi:FkbM family methyltransferase
VSVKAVAPRAEILAFEPNAGLIEGLQKVAASFEGVRVVGAGCAAEMALRTLFTPVARGIVFDQWARLEPIDTSKALDQIRRSGFTWCRPRDVSIQTATCLFIPLDGLMASSEMTIDLLKIDVEGAEADVVAGSMNLITRDQPLLMAEAPNATLVQVLEGLGYEHHVSRHGPNSLFVHPHRDRGLDRHQLARFFVQHPTGQ